MINQSALDLLTHTHTHTHTHTPHTHTKVKTVPHAILLSWRRAKVLVKVFVFEQEFLFECVALCVFPTMGKVTQKLLMEITVWEFLIFDQNLDQTGAIRTYEWINCSWKISMDPLSYHYNRSLSKPNLNSPSLGHFTTLSESTSPLSLKDRYSWALNSSALNPGEEGTLCCLLGNSKGSGDIDVP